MGSDICGNCDNFKPKPGERFFNCTSAEHAGLKYAMQVRADTRSCDAYMPFDAAPRPMPAESTPMPPGEYPPLEESPPSEERQRPVELCSRGRTVLIVGLVVAVLLLSWLLYTCASALISTPPPATPTPIPTPTPIIEYFDVAEWAGSSSEQVIVSSAARVPGYLRYGQNIRAPAPTIFIIIDVTVYNNGSTALYVSPNYFILLDSEGHVYTQGGYEAEGMFPSGQLPSGKTTSGKVLFVVPKVATGLEVVHTLPGQPPVVKAIWQLQW